MLLPLLALDSCHRAVLRVGELEQGYTIIPRQDHHGFAEVLLIEFNTNRQRHIEEVRFKLRRQSLGLGQQASRCGTGAVGAANAFAHNNSASAPAMGVIGNINGFS